MMHDAGVDRTIFLTFTKKFSAPRGPAGSAAYNEGAAGSDQLAEVALSYVCE